MPLLTLLPISLPLLPERQMRDFHAADFRCRYFRDTPAVLLLITAAQQLPCTSPDARLCLFMIFR